MKKFVFNREELRFDESRVSILKALGAVVSYLAKGVAVAFVMYLLFSLIFSNEKERRLIAENEYLAGEYRSMEEKADLVDDVVKGLEIRDRDIYFGLFNTEPVQLDQPADSSDSPDVIYSTSEPQLIRGTAADIESAEYRAAIVERELKVITDRLANLENDPRTIPSIIPLAQFRITQTGASAGQKINPFYKTLKQHTGIDLIAPVGTDVLASASGKVISVEKRAKGLGNCITIDHGDGIHTVYGHLSEVFVREGGMVEQGESIASVGNSGTTFAAALHYEVLRGGRAVDPINYFFSDISPEVYREMAVISKSTGQSMD
ncbi:MAG: M23 family metallopeptidase [Bacteroidales bacterium]|nr:M23 family metallopeptidase [Bacteroidales bacterium]